jgi:hypothetical protein
MQRRVPKPTASRAAKAGLVGRADDFWLGLGPSPSRPQTSSPQERGARRPAQRTHFDLNQPVLQPRATGSLSSLEPVGFNQLLRLLYRPEPDPDNALQPEMNPTATPRKVLPAHLQNRPQTPSSVRKPNVGASPQGKFPSSTGCSSGLDPGMLTSPLDPAPFPSQGSPRRHAPQARRSFSRINAHLIIQLHKRGRPVPDPSQRGRQPVQLARAVQDGLTGEHPRTGGGRRARVPGRAAGHGGGG